MSMERKLARANIWRPRERRWQARRGNTIEGR
jgi:hypothetical protein